jgi:hypothetical protein
VGQTHPADYELDTDPATVDGVSWHASAALDDHYEVPIPYCLGVRVNGVAIAETTTSPLPHGAPYGTIFTNLTEIDLPLPRELLRRGPNTIEITLGCAREGVDWIVVERSVLRSRRCR